MPATRVAFVRIEFKLEARLHDSLSREGSRCNAQSASYLSRGCPYTSRSWPRPPKNMIRFSSTSMGPHSQMSARLHAPHNGPPPEIVYFTRILNSIPFICGPICTKVGTDTDFRFSTLALEISTSRKGGHDDSTIIPVLNLLHKKACVLTIQNCL